MNQLPLALTDPSAHRHVRRGDSGGSLEAAIHLAESGDLEAQTLYVAGLVASMQGLTSAELAEETEAIGKKLGFEPGLWRSMVARRLPDAEDQGRGSIIGSEVRLHETKHWRRIDPSQRKCRISGRQAIRWWRREAGN